MKVEKSVSMHSHAFERPCKSQIMTDPLSRNASHILADFMGMLQMLSLIEKIQFSHALLPFP